MTDTTLIDQFSQMLIDGNLGEPNVIRILRRLLKEDETYEEDELQEKQEKSEIYLEKERARRKEYRKAQLEKRMSLPESEWGNCEKCGAKMKRSYKGNFYCVCRYAKGE